MKIPRWYIVEGMIWLFTGLPFQWFFTAFNALPFFSLPDVPTGGGGPSYIEWALIMLFLYHPFLMAPLALWQTWKRGQEEES